MGVIFIMLLSLLLLLLGEKLIGNSVGYEEM